MSKVMAATISSQRKSLLKKNPNRDSSVGDLLSEEETQRRYPFIDKEKHRKAPSVVDLRKTNNQLGILREILLNARSIDRFVQSSRPDRSSGRSQNGRSMKNNNLMKKSNNTRPTSAKSVSLSGVVDCFQRSDEDSTNSGNETDFDGQSQRSRRRHDDFDHPTTRSASLFSQTRQSTGNLRPSHNVSFLGNNSKSGDKLDSSEPAQIKKLLDVLWTEFDDLGSLTGFQSERKRSSNTCSTALAVALLTLTGHVKECARSCREKHDINNLKDQMAIIIKNQLDFQQKIENQMYTLQTMMQTVCQLVNSEIISNRKTNVTFTTQPSPVTYRAHPVTTTRHYRDSDRSQESRDSWSKPMTNAMDQLLTFAQSMNDDTPIDVNRHSTQAETSKKTSIRPVSAISSHETQSYDAAKFIPSRRVHEQDSRSSMLSPIDPPSSSDQFETALPTISSTKETLLEKILQERLRLVQHMAELSKHHEISQDELTTTLEHKGIS